jgi:hypothetical protein
MLFSLIASLMREPLYPTKDTPAMTVMRDTHLIGKGKNYTIADDEEKDASTGTTKGGVGGR